MSRVVLIEDLKLRQGLPHQVSKLLKEAYFSGASCAEVTP
jgi:hypothetical protein